jgi:hypothetical protein
VDDPTLRALRCACRWVIYGPDKAGSDCHDLLEDAQTALTPDPPHFGVANRLASLPPGWLHVGGWKDVPLHACYKAHCGHTWVWVMREDTEAFATFTLILQDIATMYLGVDPPLLLVTLQVDAPTCLDSLAPQQGGDGGGKQGAQNPPEQSTSLLCKMLRLLCPAQTSVAAPAPPTGLKVETVFDGDMLVNKLCWCPAAAQDNKKQKVSYQIWRSDIYDSSKRLQQRDWSHIKEVTTASYDDPLCINKTYYYYVTVRQLDGQKEGPPSQPSVVVTATPPNDATRLLERVFAGAECYISPELDSNCACGLMCCKTTVAPLTFQVVRVIKPCFKTEIEKKIQEGIKCGDVNISWEDWMAWTTPYHGPHTSITGQSRSLKPPTPLSPTLQRPLPLPSLASTALPVPPRLRIDITGPGSNVSIPELLEPACTVLVRGDSRPKGLTIDIVRHGSQRNVPVKLLFDGLEKGQMPAGIVVDPAGAEATIAKDENSIGFKFRSEANAKAQIYKGRVLIDDDDGGPIAKPFVVIVKNKEPE